MIKKYKISEIFKSIQGEGSRCGTVMTFIRFAGCNIQCKFCDTDFTVKREMTVEQIVAECNTEWVCLTGGEPLMQTGLWDDPLMEELYRLRYSVALETNGMFRLSHHGFSHVTMSPKCKPEDIKLQTCTDIKVIYPCYNPNDYLEWIIAHSFANKYVQPEFGKEQAAIDFVMDNPEWRLSVQTQKYIGIK